MLPIEKDHCCPGKLPGTSLVFFLSLNASWLSCRVKEVGRYPPSPGKFVMLKWLSGSGWCFDIIPPHLKQFSQLGTPSYAGMGDSAQQKPYNVAPCSCKLVCKSYPLGNRYRY